VGHGIDTAASSSHRIGALPLDQNPTPPISGIRLEARAESAPRAAPLAIRTEFERFELKYWIDERTATQVQRACAPHVSCDPFTRSKELQRNVSLYLDTPLLRFYEAHVGAAEDRFKLRVRSYGDPASPVSFLEVKRKRKTVTLKTRAGVATDDVSRALGGRADVRLRAPSDRRNLDMFLFLAARFRVEPKVVTGCYREAFASRNRWEDARVTFDREVSYQPARGARLDLPRDRWIPLGPTPHTYFGARMVMLELKFRGAPPWWMTELVTNLGLKRTAFSKYTSAIEHLRRRG
jgi:hypothetical protein